MPRCFPPEFYYKDKTIGALQTHDPALPLYLRSHDPNNKQDMNDYKPNFRSYFLISLSPKINP